MATQQRRRTQNTAGNFYVDSSCIDCDTCRWMAPEVFYQVDEQSAVHHQPTNEIERDRALQALLACPTASIGTVEPPKNIKSIQQSFPIPIEENVYDCGYHAESSFGATSYFIVHPQGNILIDSPRFASPLVKQLEAMGGIRWMYLTHQDDVADHQKYQAYFQCDRILHQADISANTKDVEIQLTEEENFVLLPDVLIIPVPGHSRGHTVLLYKDKFLFTGDHLAWSNNYQQLVAFRDFCWYSWSELIQSMKKLRQYRFEWVLPGHGRRFYADAEMMQQELEKCLQWMEN